MFIQETYMNATEHYIFGDSDVFEAWTDDKGKLFKSLQQEYGRCVGKSYIDTDEGVQHVGWVFQKKLAYEDSKELYVREVWVTLHEAPPTKTIEYHYATL